MAFLLSQPISRRTVLAGLGAGLILSAVGAGAAPPQGFYTNLELALRNPADVTTLLLNRIPFDSIPDDIARLSNLRTLLLHRNGLKTLGNGFAHLSTLESVYIGGSPALDFDQVVHILSGMAPLVGVGLDDNQMAHVPRNIGTLARCASLGLSSNDLRSLPNEIGQLARLKSLDLYNNRMHRLPEALLGLPSLERIYVRESGLGADQLDALRSKHPGMKFDETLPPELYLKLG